MAGPTPVNGRAVTFAATGNLLRSPFQFRRYGQSGQEI